MGKAVTVQPANPLAYEILHEGLLVADEAREVMPTSVRGRTFHQVALSAEAQSRVELWREYCAPAGAKFTVGERLYGGWYVGDDAGNLHFSADGLTWEIVKTFAGSISGMVYDGEVTSKVWVCTEAGEIGSWHYEDLRSDWTLDYYDADMKFMGIGISDSQLVATIGYTKNVLRSTDGDGGPWTVDEVFEKNLLHRRVRTNYWDYSLWAATYEPKPRYSSDGGATWTQTPGAAGNAIVDLDVWDGTMCACGPGGVWRTVDNGATWTTVLDTSPGGVFCVRSRYGGEGNPTAWMALTGEGGIYTSDDDGVTWTLIDTVADVADGVGERGSCLIIDASDHEQILSVHEGVIRVSMDGGATWRAGAGGAAWRFSIEAYQPVIMDLHYEVPGNERLVGAASEETFLLVGG